MIKRDKMKKLLSLLLLFSFALSFVACGESEPREISCGDIIKAYEDAGYVVSHGKHHEESEYSWQCIIEAEDSENPDENYIYFTTYFTEEQAEEAAESGKYHAVIWMIAVMYGEWRWLKSGNYGKIEYTYYDTKMIKPFNKMIRGK